MKEWRKVAIGELCDSISDTYCAKDAEVILVNTSDVLDGKILNHTKIINKDLKGQFKKTFKKNDILYSEIRPTNKRFAFVEIEDTSLYIASTKLMVLRPKVDIVEPRYLYALLKSRQMIDELQHLAESRSGTFPQITFNSELATRVVDLPTKVTQKRIISVLDVIEEKIEKNLQINNNLQQQIQLLYEDFITAIDKTPVAMSKVIDVRDGTHDSPKSLETGYPLVTSKHLFPFGVDVISPNKISEFDYNKVNERSKVDTNDILLSMIGTVGLVSLIIEEEINFAIKNVGLFKTSKCPQYTYYLLCYLKSKETTRYIEKHLAGSTQKYISLTELRKMPIIIPSTIDVNKFNDLITPLFSLIIENVKANKALTAIRDALLPKLMSGELDVTNIDV